jgi:hypothetical protein
VMERTHSRNPPNRLPGSGGIAAAARGCLQMPPRNQWLGQLQVIVSKSTV